jgi:Flp pilus assembly protein TadG
MRHFLSTLGRFFADPRGNIAILFGLAVIPLIGVMGVALDYSQANAARAELQAAIDNTALMLSKMMPLTQSQLNTDGWQIFQANLPHSVLVYAQSNLVISNPNSSTITLDINTTYNTQLASVLKLVGMNTSFPVTAHSEVVWGNSRLRVALVLDNTGSMTQSGKITALKTATTNLLNQLQGVARNNGDVYVSIIPFVNTVNIGSSNYTASYIDWYDWEHDPNNVNSGTCSISSHNGNQSGCTSSGTCSVSGYTTQSTCQAAGTCSVAGQTTQSGCTSSGTCSISGRTSQSTCGTCSISSITNQSSCTSAGVCSKSQYTTKSMCQSHSGTWTTGVWTPANWTVGTWTPATWTSATWTFSRSTWNGCVTDRGNSQVYTSGYQPGTTAGPDQDVSAPSTTTQPNPATSPDSTKFPAAQSGSTSYSQPWTFANCPQQMIGLSYDWTALQQEVNNMSPNGSTDQPIGLVWGWQSLVGGGPLTAPPLDPNYTYTQVIILLTDGLNTQNRWVGDGSTTNTSVDARMLNGSGATVAGTCQNIKNAGIVIYTVQVDTGGDPTSTLLQNCATDPTKFFLLTSSSQIVTTFQAIGTQLANLHLAQ